MAGNGRPPSFGDYAAIKRWLDPFITSAQCFGYPADRNLSATDKTLLCSDKYQRLFEEGCLLLMTWPYGFQALHSFVNGSVG